MSNISNISVSMKVISLGDSKDSMHVSYRKTCNTVLCVYSFSASATVV